MAGPVRESPSKVAREVATLEPQSLKSVSLVEKFAIQMGGVEPTKMLSTLKATAFRQPAKKQGDRWVSPEVTNEQMMALLVVANKYDLNPFIKEIYAFPDKGGIVPIVGVDGWSRMINNHPEFDGMKFVFDTEIVELEHAKPSPISCTCIIYRKDRGHPTEVTEYLDEVYRAPFKSDKLGPWQTHTKRMLRHKAMIQTARIAFGFTGIHDQDEAERIIEGEFIPAEPEKKAKDLTDRFSTEPPSAIADGDIIDAVAEPAEPEPEEVPAPEGHAEPPPEEEAPPVAEKAPPKKKAPTKKKAEKAAASPDITGHLLQSIIDAKSVAQVDEILSELEEFEGLPQAKRMIIKKAADARKKDF